MTTQDTACGVRRLAAASEAAHARQAVAPCTLSAAAHHRAAVLPYEDGTASAENHIVYLHAAFVNAMRAGFDESIDNYLDNHYGAHRVTGQFEPDHVWIAPVYTTACEIRVPTAAVWEVRE